MKFKVNDYVQVNNPKRKDDMVIGYVIEVDLEDSGKRHSRPYHVRLIGGNENWFSEWELKFMFEIGDYVRVVNHPKYSNRHGKVTGIDFEHEYVYIDNLIKVRFENAIVSSKKESFKTMVEKIRNNKMVTVQDAVNKPSHYIGLNGLEVETVLQNFLPKIKDSYVSHRVGSAIEYILRHPEKNELEDLKKARRNLDQIISYWEGGIQSED